MNQQTRLSMPWRKNLLAVLLIVSVVLIASSFQQAGNLAVTANDPVPRADSMLSKQAFLKVYGVLMSPRCMNCHPAGDVPLQGEDSHPHTQGVKRGKDGKGVYAMKCANCHQDKNIAGLNMPPGNPNWHLPPADMKMVFEGKTPRQLAAQLLNPATNGRKTKAALFKHIAEDGLVLAGWNPGEGRAQPPLTHAEFTRQFKLWLDNGAYLPD